MHYLALLFAITISSTSVGCDQNSPSSASNPSHSSSSAPVESPKNLNTEMDQKINNIMVRSGATAALVAVAKDGEVIYEQAYGFQGINQTTPLSSNALMRSGSLAKPITAAAIRALEANGVLALSDRVFCNGNNAPCWLSANLLSPTSDSRAADITIGQLVTHKGGWYRDVSGDPLTEEVEIRDSLGLAGPPSREDIIRHVLQRPLDYTPGQPNYDHDPYSSFGYLLLGLIIEQAAQSSYIDYVHAMITDPLGISPENFKIGASRLAEHDTREPNYVSTDLCPSTFTVGHIALCDEEGADNNNWFASGGIISTASAMALFAQHYRLPANYEAGYSVTGTPLITPASGAHGGLLPGSSAMLRQLPSGVSYAIFLNTLFILEADLADLDRLSQLPVAE